VSAFRDAEAPPGAVLLAREEPDPSAFGVAMLDEEGNVVDIVEKPEDPPSNLAIGGIYLYDERFWGFMDEAVADKGESFSISDVNRMYIQNGDATLLNVGEETWIDCGTPATLLQASIMAKEGRLNPHPHRDESWRESA
jgi:glucose-1-phosphate thymidylyltransferase